MSRIDAGSSAVPGVPNGAVGMPPIVTTISGITGICMSMPGDRQRDGVRRVRVADRAHVGALLVADEVDADLARRLGAAVDGAPWHVDVRELLRDRGSPSSRPAGVIRIVPSAIRAEMLPSAPTMKLRE